MTYVLPTDVLKHQESVVQVLHKSPFHMLLTFEASTRFLER